MIADRIRSIQAVSGGGGGGGGGTLATSDVLFDSSDASTLFTDAGITSVSATGDLIYQWDSKGANSQFATQATSASRPYWFYGGLRYTNFSDKFMVFPSQRYTTNMSVEAVFRPSDTTGTWRKIAAQSYASGWSTNPYFSYQLGLNNGYLHCGFAVSNNYLDGGLNSSQQLSNNTWYHAVATFDNGVFKLYLNGNLINTVDKSAFSTSILNSSGGYLTLGSSYPGIGEYFRGDIAHVATYPTTLSAAQIEENYNIFLSRQYWTSLLLNMQGTAGSTTFTDDSPNAFTVTPYGNAQLASDATFGTVASFDGNGDYVSAATSQSLALNSSDFTIEFWCYIVGSGVFSLYDSRINETAPNGNGFVFGINSSLQWVVYQAGNKIIGPTRTLNQWTHVAVTRVGTSVKMYIDGSQAVSTWTTSNSFSDGAFLIGTDYPRNARFVNGLIGPVRITKGVARYTSNFTPPTGLFPTS